MGPAASNPLKEPEIGKASNFYWACRNGKYREAEQMVSKLNYEQLNQIEPNGSTALHAATHHNHVAIVKLLIEQGCARTTLNRFQHTAYEEIRSDEMRSLFLRPTSQRFIDEDPSQSFALSSNSNENVKIQDGVPDSWFKGYATKSDAHEAKFMNAIARAPLIMRKVLQNRLEDECNVLFEEFIVNVVCRTHPNHSRVHDLLSSFKKKKSIESLLAMYTLETPIYGALQNDCEAFTALIYMHLTELKDRAYKGYAYRGARMTNNDIEAYRWALKQDRRVLETRTFQSMSLDKEKALKFATPSNENPLAVLLIFHFPELCPTAINLNKTSEKSAALSEFQDEQEVTLLPFTLFKVSDIKVGSSATTQYRITLQNVPVQKKSITGAWLSIALED